MKFLFGLCFFANSLFAGDFDPLEANHAGSMHLSRTLVQQGYGRLRETSEYVAYKPEGPSLYSAYVQLKGESLSESILEELSQFFGDVVYTVFGTSPNVADYFSPLESSFTSMYRHLGEFAYVPGDEVNAVIVEGNAASFERDIQDFVTVMYSVWHDHDMTRDQCVDLYTHLFAHNHLGLFLLRDEENNPVSARIHLYFEYKEKHVSQGWHGAVPKSFRGKGYGPLLMQYAMSKDRERGRERGVVYFMNEATPAAVGAWKKAGLIDSGGKVIEYTPKILPN